MKGFIYALIDPRNEKIYYVGQTRFKINKRYNEHLRNVKYMSTKNQSVYIWINELLLIGLKPKIITLESVQYDLLDDREIYWINKYKSQLKNKTKGGVGIKFIEKRKFSDEHRKKIGDSCRGNKHYNYKKPAKNRISLIALNPDDLSEKYRFDSIKEASDFFNIKANSISSCLSNKRNSAGNYIWIYEKDINNINIINDKINKFIKNPPNSRKKIPILKINPLTDVIIESYDSIKEAAKLNNTSDAAIRYACYKSKSGIGLGYKWKTL